ncbi:outer membrane protein assembly factor BamC [Thioalkalivibrio sp. HK1]|uniref:outer membrane protein assembly factor BamC n=1 Tax=Thioalkalivibrio sp. HK1 TaxID=1469245 RepID=UPI0018CC0694|nr:outer membrane protein assembly factor BamC [Thioalkalivibrio sp. HK1]
MQSRQVNENRIDSEEIEVRTGAKKEDSIEGKASIPFRIATLSIASILIALTGCTQTITVDDLIPERQPPYRSSTSLPPLEVPPDLERTAINDPLALPNQGATHSQYAAGNDPSNPAVLPSVDSVSIMRNGNRRWLVVEAEPEALWPRLREFWLRQGFTLVKEEPASGVMETDWLERSGDLPVGLVQSLLSNISKVLYGVGVRDQYRTRIDRADEPGATEIHISHLGTERIFSDGEATGQRHREGVGEMVWKPIAADPGLEAEMLTRMMVFLGLKDSQADSLIEGTPVSAVFARIESDERHPLFLRLEEDPQSAWQRIGRALARAGFTIEGRDEAQGVYRVSYIDDTASEASASWLSGLKFWERSGSKEPEPETYRLLLIGQNVEGVLHTRLVVQKDDGVPDAGPDAMRVLSLLQSAL